MTHEDALQTIKLLTDLREGIWWVCAWLVIILFFKDCK